MEKAPTVRKQYFFFRNPSNCHSRCHPTFLSAAVAAGLFAALVLLPSANHWLTGISLTASMEESFGYRYIGSLRVLYGDEDPFLAQGHLPSLLHLPIQSFLDWLRHPTNEIHPRIDRFGVIAILMPIVLGGITMALLLHRLPNVAFRFSVALATLAVVYAPPMNFTWLTRPDYHLWALTIAFGSTWQWLRLADTKAHAAPRWREAIVLSISIGAGVSVKLTYALFWLPHVALYLYRCQSPALMIRFLGSTIIGATLVWIGFLFLYYGDISAVAKFLRDLGYFLGTQRSTLAKQSGLDLFSLLSSALPNPLQSLALLPVLAIATAAFYWTQQGYRMAAIGFGLSTIAGLMAAMQRPYWGTFIESQLLALMALTALSWLSIKSAPGIFQNRWRLCAPALIVLIIFGGCALSLQVVHGIKDFYKLNSDYQVANAELEKSILHAEGKVALLSGNNAYRITSIYGGICKGGSEIFAPHLGLSTYTQKLFPNLWCGLVPGKIREDSFSLLIFMQLKTESFSDALQRTSSFFQFQPSAITCDKSIKTVNATLHLCHPVKTALAPM